PSVVLLITLLAFALRVYHLDAMSFWSDEGISVIRARVEFPHMLDVLPLEHVPLYFVALHQWMHAAGEGDFAVRFFSLWFSVLTVPLVYQLGELLDRGRKHVSVVRRRSSIVGTLSALLCAINPLQVWYAQEARMYALVVALCAGAAWCLLRAQQDGRRLTVDHVCVEHSSIVHRPSSIVQLALSGVGAAPPKGPSFVYYFVFALLSAAALYTHFFAALVIAAFALWTLLAAWKRALHAPLALGAFALIALLFVPWLPRAFGALSFPGWQAAADPLSLPARYLVAYTLGSTAGEWQPLALVFLALLIVGCVVLARRADVRALFALLYVFVPFALLMLIALRKPGYHERYLIVITPLLFVILAVALNALVSLRVSVRAARAVFPAVALLVLASNVLSLSNLYFDPSFAKPDYRASAQYVDRLSRAGDGLIFDGPDPHKAFYRYFSRQRTTAYDQLNFDTEDANDVSAFLSAKAPQHERWWVVLYFHPAGMTEDWLAQYGYLVSSRWFNGIRVLLYATPSDVALSTAAPIEVQSDVPLRVLDVRTLPHVQPGDLLPVIVHWQATDALPADYQVSLRVLDANERIVKQLDRRPLDGRVPTSQWKIGEMLEDRYGLLLPDDLPSGEYRVQLILYRLSGGDVLRASLASVRVD
ncbi:MAG: hypothetical protein LC737_06230, partial [Chloroflexi bacterium]|nr:hypothetical protein [Chloroflexota bacterium]